MSDGDSRLRRGTKAAALKKEYQIRSGTFLFFTLSLVGSRGTTGEGRNIDVAVRRREIRIAALTIAIVMTLPVGRCIHNDCIPEMAGRLFRRVCLDVGQRDLLVRVSHILTATGSPEQSLLDFSVLLIFRSPFKTANHTGIRENSEPPQSVAEFVRIPSRDS